MSMIFICIMFGVGLLAGFGAILGSIAFIASETLIVYLGAIGGSGLGLLAVRLLSWEEPAGRLDDQGRLSS